MFKRHKEGLGRRSGVLRRGALLALACLAVGSAIGPLASQAQPPDSISVRKHQGERAPSGSENWTGGNISGYSEGDQIRFRFTLSANEPASGLLDIHFTKQGNGCDPFFTNAFAFSVEPVSGDQPTVAAVGGAVQEGEEWVQTLSIDFAGGGEAIVVYVLTLSGVAGDCTGSSQHSRLFPGDPAGDVHQMGRQNVPVAAPDEAPPEASLLEVVKDLRPATDPGRFDLLINGSVEFADAGPGDTTGPVEVDPGSHVIGEEAGTATDLADYRISVACVNQVGEPVAAVLVPGPDPVVFSVVVDEGEHVVCTITNRARAQYDGGGNDDSPADNPFGDGDGTGDEIITSAGPSGPSAATADPVTDVAGENLAAHPGADPRGGVLPSADGSTGGGGQTVDTDPLGVAGMAELPRTGLPLAPQVFSGLTLIALGRAARAGGRRQRPA
jgi:hypothetical protein